MEPSAESRSRVQSAQNGWETDEMNPTDPPPSSNRYAIRRVMTDKMQPDIFAGDLIVVDKVSTKIKHGGVYCGFRKGSDEPELYRCTLDKNGDHVFAPSNRSYPLIAFESFDVTARVVWVFRPNP